LIKNIVTFYKKAQSFDNLATFYEACALIEMDEYKNYEKALAALGQARECAGQMSGNSNKGAKIDVKISVVEEFL
jgi:intraflagellar transport protein 140